MNGEDAILLAGIAIVVVVVGGLACFGVVRIRTESACLSAGYPSAQVDWALNRYCVKRIDQTDVVVPLNKAVR